MNFRDANEWLISKLKESTGVPARYTRDSQSFDITIIRCDRRPLINNNEAGRHNVMDRNFASRHEATDREYFLAVDDFPLDIPKVGDEIFDGGTTWEIRATGGDVAVRVYDKDRKMYHIRVKVKR